MGGCATKPKALADPLPTKEEPRLEHKPRGFDASEEEVALEAKREEGGIEKEDKAVQVSAAGGREEANHQKHNEVGEEDAKQTTGGGGCRKEDWHVDEFNRRSLVVLFMEDDGEPIAGTASSASTSAQQQQPEPQSDGKSPPVVVTEDKKPSEGDKREEQETNKAQGAVVPEEQGAKPEEYASKAAAEEHAAADKETGAPPTAPPVGVVLAEEPCDVQEGSVPEEQVGAKPEDTGKEQEFAADNQSVVPLPPPPVLVELTKELVDKPTTCEGNPPAVTASEEDAHVAGENPKADKSTKEVVLESVGVTEGLNQQGTGAAEFTKEVVFVTAAAAAAPEAQEVQPEHQELTCGDSVTSSAVLVEAAARDVSLGEEEQLQATNIEAPVITSSGAVAEHTPEAERTESVEEESSQPSPPPADVAVSEAALIEVEKKSKDVPVDEPAPLKIESDGEEKAASSDTEKAAEQAAVTEEAGAKQESSQPPPFDVVDPEPAQVQVEKKVSDDEPAPSKPDTAGEEDKAEATDAEKPAAQNDAASTVAVDPNQEGARGGDELPACTPVSTDA